MTVLYKSVSCIFLYEREREILPLFQFFGLCGAHSVCWIRFLDEAALHGEGIPVSQDTGFSIFGVNGNRIYSQAVRIVLSCFIVRQKCYAAYVLRCHHQVVHGIR
jgi:hypothetical protein